MESPWFAGEVALATFEIEELLGTKLRALYQRRKGRDLCDIGLALSARAIDEQKLVDCFQRYMANEGKSVARAEFETNLQNKLQDPGFRGDVVPLLTAPERYDPALAARAVLERLISRLP